MCETTGDILNLLFSLWRGAFALEAPQGALPLDPAAAAAEVRRGRRRRYTTIELVLCCK